MSFTRGRARLVVLLIVVASVGYAVARSKRDFYDFEVYRTAGVRLLHAAPLYQPEDGHFTFKYWPAFAIAMTPFAFMPAEAGKALWYALSVGLLAAFFAQSVNAVPDRRRSVKFLVWMALLVTGKFIVKELVNGQTNTLFGVLILWALFAARRGNRNVAGVAVGLATLVKPYALLFLPWLLLSEGLVAALAAAGVIGAGLLLPAAIYGWQANLDLLGGWYRIVSESTPTNLLFPENISFATMWAKWIGVGRTASTMAIVTAVAFLTAGLAMWWQRQRVAEPRLLEVAFLLLLVPLISPQGWDYVLLLATPAIVVLLDRFALSSLPWRVAMIAGVMLTSFTIYDLVGRRAYFFLMEISATTMGAIILAACLVRLRFTRLA